MADESWTDYALPLAAAAASLISPRYGGQAANLALSAYGLSQRVGSDRRYKDYLNAKLVEDQTGREQLARTMYHAGGVELDDSGQPLKEIPLGKSYVDAVGGRNANAATQADAPQPFIKPQTANLAAALARAGDETGARELAAHDIKENSTPTADELYAAMQRIPLEAGSEVQGTARGGLQISRKRNAAPETEGLTVKDDEIAGTRKWYDRTGKLVRSEPIGKRPPPHDQQEHFSTGTPYEEMDDAGKATGNLVFPITNTNTGEVRYETRQGRKPRAGGGSPDDKKGKGSSVLADIFGDGAKLGDDKGDAGNAPDGVTAVAKDGTRIVSKKGRWRVVVPKVGRGGS